MGFTQRGVATEIVLVTIGVGYAADKGVIAVFDEEAVPAVILRFALAEGVSSGFNVETGARFFITLQSNRPFGVPGFNLGPAGVGGINFHRSGVHLSEIG